MRSQNPRVLLAAAIALIAAGCQARSPDAAQKSEPVSEQAPGEPSDQSLSLVIARNATMLMGIPGVVGVYEGETAGKHVLRVLVVAREDSILSRLPRTLEGYDVEIEVSDPIKPMNR
jgi:hypothetical protein